MTERWSIKLRSPEYKSYFLIDAGRLDLFESLDVDEEVPHELFELFIKRRRPLVTQLVNFRRSQLSKQQWRSSRWKFLKGIRKFSRSLKSKRMHRSLARFLATRITRPHMSSLKDRYESLDVLQFDALKALSSYRTHLFIDGEFYQPIEEEVEYFALLEYVLPLLSSIELKIYRNSNTELDEDETELLWRLLDEEELCRVLAQDIFESARSEELVDLYRAAQAGMISQGSSLDETYFLSRLMDEHFLPAILMKYGENISQKVA